MSFISCFQIILHLQRNFGESGITASETTFLLEHIQIALLIVCDLKIIRSIAIEISTIFALGTAAYTYMSRHLPTRFPSFLREV